jgi:hypothetical protein
MLGRKQGFNAGFDNPPTLRESLFQNFRKLVQADA